MFSKRLKIRLSRCSNESSSWPFIPPTWENSLPWGLPNNETCFASARRLKRNWTFIHGLFLKLSSRLLMNSKKSSMRFLKTRLNQSSIETRSLSNDGSSLLKNKNVLSVITLRRTCFLMCSQYYWWSIKSALSLPMLRCTSQWWCVPRGKIRHRYSTPS